MVTLAVPPFATLTLTHVLYPLSLPVRYARRKISGSFAVVVARDVGTPFTAVYRSVSTKLPGEVIFERNSTAASGWTLVMVAAPTKPSGIPPVASYTLWLAVPFAGMLSVTL